MSRMSSLSSRIPLSRPFRILFGLLLLLGLGLTCASALQSTSQPRPRGPKKITTPPKGEPMTEPADKAAFKEVDRLIQDQKMEAASALVMKILEQARRAGDEATWTRALIREVQLRTALHGYETSVRFLKTEPWPQGALSRLTLELFYAHSLVTYQQVYSYEIGTREKVESKGAIDLKAWTGEQIRAEAARAYASAWQQREKLGREPVSRLSEFLEPNNYPAGIRDSLRDAISYLFVEFLADTAGWRPEQSNDLFQLDLPALIAGNSKAQAVALDDPAVHPLLRIGAILTDLESWHEGDGAREGALEARLERLRRLHASFTKEADRQLIRKDLARRLATYRTLPWWSTGQAELAEYVRQEPSPDNLVRARALAVAGVKAFPDSPGSLRCASIVESIGVPDFQLAAMSSDGLARRSIQVTHKNMASITFRAYPIELEKRVTQARDYHLFPAGPELVKL
ncbi:MAG: hypothetical protein ABIT01_15465, partial [Thermoanaerobaculia bacterium]